MTRLLEAQLEEMHGKILDELQEHRSTLPYKHGSNLTPVEWAIATDTAYLAQQVANLRVLVTYLAGVLDSDPGETLPWSHEND